MPVAVRLAYAAAIFCIGIAGGSIPYLIQKQSSQASASAWLSIGNTFSAGLFISAGFMHLLPEAVISLSALSQRYGFEFGFAFASFGFILLFLVEEVVENVCCLHSSHHHQQLHTSGDDITGSRNHSHASLDNGNGGVAASPARVLRQEPGENEGLQYGAVGAVDTKAGGTAALMERLVDSERGCIHKGEYRGSRSVDSPRFGCFLMSSCSSMHVNGHIEQHPTHEVMVPAGVALGAALGFHSIMEGLGLGAVDSTKTFGVFLAILTHKGLSAFSLGVVLLDNGGTGISRLRYMSLVLAFAFLTPFGAVLGMVLRHCDSKHVEGGSVGRGVWSGVCTALAAGTFIHVASMEILPREMLHDMDNKYVKIGSLVLGYLLFTILSVWI